MIDSYLNAINYAFKEYRSDLRYQFKEQIPAFVLDDSLEVTIAEAFIDSVWKVMGLCVNERKIQASTAKRAANLAYRLLKKGLIPDSERDGLERLHERANQEDFE